MPFPTHLILGFLGAGKTTAIRDLLTRKPAGETWAVLVNEFGEVGIDGQLLADTGAFVREVPGGCMCCVAGLPMQMGLNMLIREARPDRLLIEPTGLGHPARIIETLQNEFYQDVLSIGASIGLVDPRRLDEPRVTGNVHFRDQVAAADVLVANKTDLCTPQQIRAFWQWAEALTPAKQRLAQTRQGRLELAWLDAAPQVPHFESPHAHDHRHESSGVVDDGADSAWQMRENHGQGYFSLGWRMAADYRFDADAVVTWLTGTGCARYKAVLNTVEGWFAFNGGDGAISRYPTAPAADNRLELIADTPLDATCLESGLRDTVRG
ncbi:GTP-binding protein [Marinobacter halodurans]|uniref:GTP-binding protein n=1 Tax=Marinobacter halodurans TaxID=2528979 RepID=A0ABY1ZHY3_9GAMM|nr:GTP-binding protein [Marinobacter halodurans]TBW53765.1 GTP-binding protein [Marinobacter halodurans]